MYSYTEFHLNS